MSSLARNPHDADVSTRRLSVGSSAIAGIALAITTLMSTAACSSTKPIDTAASRVSPAFLQRAEGVCSDVLAKGESNRGRLFPYSDFDPMHPNVITLPLVGQFFQHATSGWQEIQTRFDELGVPANGAPAWSRVVGLVNASARNQAAQVRAALASNAAGFVTTVKEVQRLSPQLQSALSTAGFEQSSPCVSFLTH